LTVSFTTMTGDREREEGEGEATGTTERERESVEGGETLRKETVTASAES
jgi:hypothetical protein